MIHRVLAAGLALAGLTVFAGGTALGCNDSVTPSNRRGGTGGAGTGGSGPCFVQIAAAGLHTCARGDDGSLWCWGSNSSGELGNGTNVDAPLPVQVEALGTNVAEIATGSAHSCARKDDGTVWCWGDNSSGELGDGTTTSSNVPVQVTSLGTSAAEAATGYSHSCARKADGTLWCWGSNSSGELGDGTTTSSNVPVQVAALGTSGVEVAAGQRFTCARKAGGTVWCWGDNGLGQLGDGTMTSHETPVQVTPLGTSVVEVASGGYHSCARKADGSVWCWGRSDHGQIGDGVTHQQCGPASDCSPTPAQVVELGTSVVEVAAGDGHTCARKADGSVWCWGGNICGALGDGTEVDKPLPVRVPAGCQ